jgi:hypothetical protein
LRIPENAYYGRALKANNTFRFECAQAAHRTKLLRMIPTRLGFTCRKMQLLGRPLGHSNSQTWVFDRGTPFSSMRSTLRPSSLIRRISFDPTILCCSAFLCFRQTGKRSLCLPPALRPLLTFPGHRPTPPCSLRAAVKGKQLGGICPAVQEYPNKPDLLHFVPTSWAIGPGHILDIGQCIGGGQV